MYQWKTGLIDDEEEESGKEWLAVPRWRRILLSRNKVKERIV